MSETPIKSFRDLEVYRNTYQACLDLHNDILSKLPQNEHFDLYDQLNRSSKAVPRLIAEGYAKRQQKFGFQKYLADAMAECNETIVGLEQSRDIYKLDKEICGRLIDLYDKSGRQLYKLSQAWTNFKKRE